MMTFDKTPLFLGLLCAVVWSFAASAEVAPGDVVTAETRDAIRELIPEPFHPYTIDNFSGLEMTIVEPETYALHPNYIEATSKYACQVALGSDEQLEHYTSGQPFPHSEWAVNATEHACDLDLDAPDAGLKLAWNANYRWMAGGIYYPHLAQSFWRAKGDNTWQLAQGFYRRTVFSHRADLLPERTELVPGTDLEWAETIQMVTPFDQRGTIFLILRHRDSRKREDAAFAYIPTLRRVRRISTEQKADSVQGSDFTLEDFFLFSGYVWDQDWRYLGEREQLVALDSDRACFPLNVEGWKPDAEGAIGNVEQFSQCRFGPYKSLFFVGERWQRRQTFGLEQRPKSETHPYSRKVLWYDKETYAPISGIAYDRDGEPLRVFWYLYDWSETSARSDVHGSHVLLPIAVVAANVQTQVSNLLLSFATRSDELSPEAAKRLYDLTRLKRLGR